MSAQKIDTHTHTIALASNFNKDYVGYGSQIRLSRWTSRSLLHEDSKYLQMMVAGRENGRTQKR